MSRHRAGVEPMLIRSANGDTLSVTTDLSVQMTVRPWRYGLLIGSDSIADASRAVGVAASSWGGVGWPLLPVAADGEIDERAYTIAAAVGIDAVLDCRAPFDQSVTPLAPGRRPFGLAVRQLTDDAPDGGLAADGRCAPPNLAEAKVVLPASSRIVDLVGAGTMAGMTAARVWHSYGAVLRQSPDATVLARAQVAGQTAVAASADAAATVRRGRIGTIGLVWVTPGAESDGERELADAIAFWNLRALRGRGGQTGVTLIVDQATFGNEEVIAAVKATVAASTPHKPSCLLIAPHLERDAVAELAKKVGATAADESVAVRQWRRDSPTLAGLPTVSSRRKDQLVVQGVVPSAPHPAIVGHGEMALVLRSDYLEGPRRAGVARLYHPDGVWAEDGLAIPASPAPNQQVTLALPTGGEILDAALAERGATSLRSETGDLADQLLAALTDPSLVRRPEIHVLLNALAAYAGPPERAIRSASLAASLGLSGAETHAVELGLRALSVEGLVKPYARIDCTRCGLTTYPRVAGAGEPPHCDVCGALAAYATTRDGEPEFGHRCHPVLTRLAAEPLPILLAALSTLTDAGAYCTLFPQVKSDHGWERIDGLGWQETTLFALIVASPDALERRDRVLTRIAHTGVEQVTLVGNASREVTDSYAHLAADLGLRLVTLDGERLMLPPLAEPPARRTYALAPDTTELRTIDGVPGPRAGESLGEPYEFAEAAETAGADGPAAGGESGGLAKDVRRAEPVRVRAAKPSQPVVRAEPPVKPAAPVDRPVDVPAAAVDEESVGIETTVSRLEETLEGREVLALWERIRREADKSIADASVEPGSTRTSPDQSSETGRTGQPGIAMPPSIPMPPSAVPPSYAPNGLSDYSSNARGSEVGDNPRVNGSPGSGAGRSTGSAAVNGQYGFSAGAADLWSGQLGPADSLPPAIDAGETTISRRALTEQMRAEQESRQRPARGSAEPTPVDQPRQPAPRSPRSPTAIPPTALPPTAVPPSSASPTAVPPTALPPTAVPPTAQPPVSSPAATPPASSGRPPHHRMAGSVDPYAAPEPISSINPMAAQWRSLHSVPDPDASKPAEGADSPPAEPIDLRTEKTEGSTRYGTRHRHG